MECILIGSNESLKLWNFFIFYSVFDYYFFVALKFNDSLASIFTPTTARFRLTLHCEWTKWRISQCWETKIKFYTSNSFALNFTLLWLLASVSCCRLLEHSTPLLNPFFWSSPTRAKNVETKNVRALNIIFFYNFHSWMIFKYFSTLPKNWMK